MFKTALLASALALASVTGFSHAYAAEKPAAAKGNLDEFELMTWPEVKAALAAGKTTALYYTGGVEERGPQDVNGGHNLMARAINKAIADKLGNAIAMPVLTFTPNEACQDRKADPDTCRSDLPGTIGLTNDLLGAILERLTQQAIVTGFKNVILMGDHGGGQGGKTNVYADVAKKMNDKYSPQGIHVYYCDQVYQPANNEFDKYLESKGIPSGGHGSVVDTSLMMYLDKGQDVWVRKNEIPNALGAITQPGPDGRPVVVGTDPHNGIQGDGRKSTAELGKRLLDTKVEFAVKQIREQIASGM